MLYIKYLSATDTGGALSIIGWKRELAHWWPLVLGIDQFDQDSVVKTIYLYCSV